jgi:seryl-tRNA synthetase
LQALNAEKNSLSEQIGLLMRAGERENAEGLKKIVTANKEKSEALQNEANEIEAQLKATMFSIPNILADSVPNGIDENENVEVKKHLTPKTFSFKPLAH